MSDLANENPLSFFEGLGRFILRIGEVFSSVQNWYEQHADTINAYLFTFAKLSIWFSAVQSISEVQIIFTDDLSMDMAQEIIQSDNVSAIVERYYTESNDRKINNVIDRCQQAKQTASHSELFSQTIAAYRSEHYQLACLGMLSIVDGVLSDVSGKISTSYKTRLQEIEKKISDKVELSDADKKLFCIIISMEGFEDSIFKNSDFSQAESAELNRHRLIHGRTHRKYTKLDFIKIILWLDAIIFLGDKLIDHEAVNET